MAETKSSRRKKKQNPEKSPPWEAVWGILNCKRRHSDVTRARNRRIVCSRLIHRHSTLSPDPIPNPTSNSSLSSSSSSSFRVLHLRRLSGCYECQTAADSINGVYRNPSPRIISPCPDCDEIFFNPETLDLHQIEKHGVMELGLEDSSRNIVDIIFQSSWMKKESPACKIERILKINNSKKTITRFEEYRDIVKNRAGKLTKKNPRCAADGNELLRFRSTAVACDLGGGGICSSAAAEPCGVCGIIRYGFRVSGKEGIVTMGTSGRAHDVAAAPTGGEAAGGGARAMLVCRVIAGRVRKNQEGFGEEFDSVSGGDGAYSTMDELIVFNPRAILPCFVVIYSGF